MDAALAVSVFGGSSRTSTEPRVGFAGDVVVAITGGDGSGIGAVEDRGLIDMPVKKWDLSGLGVVVALAVALAVGVVGESGNGACTIHESSSCQHVCVCVCVDRMTERTDGTNGGQG